MATMSMDAGLRVAQPEGFSVYLMERRLVALRLDMPWWIGLDLAPGVRVYRLSMERNGLLIGEVAQRSGASRKALRVYESAGILPPSRRTLSGYRLYTAESHPGTAPMFHAR
jgi:hypothetical protein